MRPMNSFPTLTYDSDSDSKTVCTKTFDSGGGAKILIKHDASTEMFYFGIMDDHGIYREPEYLGPISSLVVKTMLQTLKNPPAKSTQIHLNDDKTLRCRYSASYKDFGICFTFTNSAGAGPRTDGAILKDLGALIGHLTARLTVEAEISAGQEQPHFGLGS